MPPEKVKVFKRRRVSSESRGPDVAAAGWRGVLLALVVTASFLLGSGSGTWSLGAVCCVMGATVFLAPPGFRLPTVATLSLVVFGLVPLVGLLPSSWFGIHSTWREMLRESWGIPVPSTISPDPRASFESWLVVAAGVVWLWTCLGQKISDDGRRWCLYTLAAGGALVAAASWIDNSTYPFSWWPQDAFGANFGPFANRNHTSSLNAISCILCAAATYDTYRRKSYLGWFFAALFFLPLGAIFMNTSRGGLLIFFAGMVAWITTAAMKQGFFRKIVVGVAILLAVFSVALVSTGKLGERLRGLVKEEKVSVLTSSMRIDLARETLSLMVERPWIGRGFDTFSTIFPIVSDLDVSDVRFLHPESDVLLLVFEGGLLALVPCGLLLIWLMNSSGPWKKGGGEQKSHERSARRWRQTAAIGAGMALVHSIFDVPNHGLAYGMHTALLLGLAIRPRRLKTATGKLEQVCFRGAGIGIIALGIMWLGIASARWSPDLPTTVPVLREEAVGETQKGRYREALALVDRAIWLAPLNYELYYFRAQLLLQLRQRPERALLDFGRSRTLEPHYASTCFEEGDYWLPFAPEMAIIPWRECLRRHPRESSALNGAYDGMLSRTGLYPELRPPLWAMADSPEMQVTFLKATKAGAEWESYLAKFLAEHSKLEMLEPEQLQIFFKLWHDKGDPVALVKWMQEHPRLMAYGWRVVAQTYAREGRYKEAVLLAAKYLKRPDRPATSRAIDLVRLEKAFVFNPTDARPGIELFYAQRAAGDIGAAKATAEKVVALPESPAYMKLELASIYADLLEMRRAWELMEQVMLANPEG
jgi:tetratricopeptide (TPR) repeat protein